MKLRRLFDDGTASSVESNYDSLGRQVAPAGVPAGNASYVFALIGPPNDIHNYIAQRASIKYNLLLILWAFDFWDNYSPPGPRLTPGALNMPKHGKPL